MNKIFNRKTSGCRGSTNTWIVIFLIVIAVHVIIILGIGGFRLLKSGIEIFKDKKVETSKELKFPAENPTQKTPSQDKLLQETEISASAKTQLLPGKNEKSDETEQPPLDVNKLISSLDTSSENTEDKDVPSIEYQSPRENPPKTVKISNSTDIPGNLYVVVEGDTLRKIATMTGVSMDDIRKKNHLEKDVVKIGQKLVIPEKSADKNPTITVNSINRSKQSANSVTTPSKPQVNPSVSYKTYRVGKGDTLNKIATIFHTSPENLSKINDISDPHKLKAGMEIKVPKE